MMSSGTYAEFATGPRTCIPLDEACRGGTAWSPVRSGGETKSPTPISGKQVIVGATSPGRRTLRIRFRRRRMLRSTFARKDHTTETHVWGSQLSRALQFAEESAGLLNGRHTTEKKENAYFLLYRRGPRFTAAEHSSLECGLVKRKTHTNSTRTSITTRTKMDSAPSGQRPIYVAEN